MADSTATKATPSGVSQRRSSIAELSQEIRKWLHIPDEDLDVIDFTLAVYVSNRMAGDPLWGLIIDASGGGKTELLRSLRKREDSYFLSKLTDKSLKSGYRDPKNPSKDPSLLPKLNGKVLIIKDLSPLLTMRRDSRGTIISDLRDAYDGFSDDAFGNVGKVSYESRFSVLAASTLSVERYSAVDEELGERFIKFRARASDNRAKVRRAIENVGRDSQQRGEIIQAIDRFLDQIPKDLPSEVPVELQEPLILLSDFTATARSSVARDRNHTLYYIPRPEVGTRLGKELGKLLLALACIRGKRVPDEDDLKTACRVAEDCLPPNRLLVLRSVRCGHACTSLPTTTLKNTQADLGVLGVLNDSSGLTGEWKEALENVPYFLL